MNKTFIIILAFMFVGCSNTIDMDFIKKHSWKYGSGDGWAGDWLSFGKSPYKLNHDTLFVRDTAKAIIISLDKNNPLSGNDMKMKIKIIETGKFGIYHEK